MTTIVTPHSAVMLVHRHIDAANIPAEKKLAYFTRLLPLKRQTKNMPADVYFSTFSKELIAIEEELKVVGG
jgi:hypothetical protein